jgi:hypothetical protein
MGIIERAGRDSFRRRPAQMLVPAGAACRRRRSGSIRRAGPRSEEVMVSRNANVVVRPLRGRSFVVELHGDHDLSTKSRVRDALGGLDAAERIIIDLRCCTFVDSTVIAAILTSCSANPPGEHQRISLVTPPDTSYVNRALAVIGVRELVAVHDSLDQALADGDRGALRRAREAAERRGPPRPDRRGAKEGECST